MMRSGLTSEGADQTLGHNQGKRANSGQAISADRLFIISTRMVPEDQVQ